MLRQIISCNNNNLIIINLIYIHTYHSRLIPEGVSEASQIFLQDGKTWATFYRNDLAMKNTADVTGDKPIAV
jgi:hypothetical protein